MARKLPPPSSTSLPSAKAGGAEVPVEHGSAVLVGRFGAPHGLRGEIRLQSFTQDPLAITNYGALTDSSGRRKFEIKHLRQGGKGIFVAKVVGVSDRNTAETLTNIEIYADRAQLPPESADEFYISDLIGLVATTPEGKILGEVVDVVNYGAGDLVELRTPQGGETLLFAFTKAVVPEINISAKRLVIVPPVEIEGELRPDKA